MKPLLVVAGLITSIAVAAPARAGGYVAAGLGSDAVLTGDLDDQFDAEATGSGRLAFGVRHGPLALEASAFGAAFAGVSPLAGNRASRGDFSPLSLGVDLKYHLGVPLLPKLEAYGRAGLNRTWVIASGHSFAVSHSGRGHALGGGVQLPFRTLPIVQAALWLDYTRHSSRLESASGESLRGNAHMLMLGISLGTRL